MSVLIENIEMPKDCEHCRFNSASGQITALCDLVGWIKIKDGCRADECPLAETQPEIMSDGTLHITVNADVANIDRILLSQAGTHTGDLYYKDDEKPEPQWIPCSDCERKCEKWENSKT